MGLQVEPETSNPNRDPNCLVHRLHGMAVKQYNTQQHRQVVGSPLKQI